MPIFSTSSTQAAICFRRLLAGLVLASAVAAFAGPHNPALAQDMPGFNLPGGDYYHFQMTDLHSSRWPGDDWQDYVSFCTAMCDDDPYCKAMTVVPAGLQADYPVCWLKAGGYGVAADPRMHSWVDPQYGASQGSYFREAYHHSVEFGPGQDAAQCRALCQSDSQCKAFTYWEPGSFADSGVCQLLHQEPSRMVSELYCHSGLIHERVTSPDESLHLTHDPLHASEVTPSSSRMDGVNLPGLDYTNFEVEVGDYRVCQHACGDDPRCRAYTYVRPGVQGVLGRCWLKHGVPASIWNPHTVSGVLR
ncbi:MAG: hypothetical protein D6E12_04940 [Desulfovibrio sp.]|nr:MAG: hypothetical protein D6E12_04940 [Desulfovibrio sp.]